MVTVAVLLMVRCGPDGGSRDHPRLPPTHQSTAIDELIARTLCAAYPSLAHAYSSCVPGGAAGAAANKGAAGSKCFGRGGGGVCGR